MDRTKGEVQQRQQAVVPTAKKVPLQAFLQRSHRISPENFCNIEVYGGVIHDQYASQARHVREFEERLCDLCPYGERNHPRVLGGTRKFLPQKMHWPAMIRVSCGIAKPKNSRAGIPGILLGKPQPIGLPVADQCSGVGRYRNDTHILIAVSDEQGVAIDDAGEPNAPERRRAPLIAAGRTLRPVVGKSLAHVVQQHIGIGVDQLVRQMRLARRIAGHEFRLVAARTGQPRTRAGGA